MSIIEVTGNVHSFKSEVFKIKTNDIKITELIECIHKGKIQLPDFQRDWIWDDNHIRALISSIVAAFPIGAAMFLSCGNLQVKFKCRAVEGAPSLNNEPETLILDGQQRLTSIYASLYSKNVVMTKSDKGKSVRRFYYIDIEKSLDSSVDKIDAIISVPEDKVIRTDFNRKIELDVSSAEKEFENQMFPLNIVFDTSAKSSWRLGYYQHYNFDGEIIARLAKFESEIVEKISSYTIPVIFLDKETSKEAVCQVFENVNTGGVSLTVFELMTATFATENFQLRDDWNKRRKKIFSDDILNVVTATDFLTACTLLVSYKRGGTVSCKKKDVLNLKLAEYKDNADELTNGFICAKKFLKSERIFSGRDLPYTTQLIPLSVIFALTTTNNLIGSNVKDKISQWYWCGVFGELYAGETESRYANDVKDVMNWINNESLPDTVQSSNFNPLRLLSLQTRQSAAYKGIMALIMKNHCKDFLTGDEMDFVLYENEKVDIHHIFPRRYCEKCNYDKLKWNSIINKTPLTAKTNRVIGGNAPSQYIKKIEQSVNHENLRKYLVSHWIFFSDLVTDNFNSFIVCRARYILDAIEKSTGKKILGRNSDEVIKFFGSYI